MEVKLLLTQKWQQTQQALGRMEVLPNMVYLVLEMVAILFI
jgi:hypothetical protein